MAARHGWRRNFTALQAMHADVAVIVMSGHGNIATAVHMTKLGAFDYLEKPLSLYGVLAVIKRALEYRQRQHKVDVQEPVPSQIAVLPPDPPQLSLTGGQETRPVSLLSTHDMQHDAASGQAFSHFRQRTLCR